MFGLRSHYFKVLEAYCAPVPARQRPFGASDMSFSASEEGLNSGIDAYVKHPDRVAGPARV
jgi:hypothetical protein